MTTSSNPHPSPRSLRPLLLLLGVLFYLTPTTQAIRFLGLSDTYAQYPMWHACPNASLSFEFKTRQPSAMLVYTDNNGRYDYVHLALTKGNVRLLITYLGEENRFVDIEANTAPLNDGGWHRVEIRRNRMETVLFVDGTQTSKVAIGSDYDIGLDVSDRKNYVYFGGLPSNYGKLPAELLGDERFRGELRNILYFNCSCIPVRVRMVQGRGVSEADPEACEVRDPCPPECPCVSSEDGSGCACTYKRECLKQFQVGYELPMDEIDDRAVINYSGLDSIVEGTRAQLVDGVRNNALLLNGRAQWLRVTGAEHRRECMGDLARCDKGYYMGMWLQFRNAISSQPGVYLSNGGHGSRGHGVAILYTNGHLQVYFKMADGRKWRVETGDVVDGRWYHVAASWTEDKGLYLYINGQLKSHDRRATQTRAASQNLRSNGFYIGRANDNTGTDRLGEVLVDDFKFVAAFMNETQVREAGAISHYYLSFDEIRQDQVRGKGLVGRVFGSASLVSGKMRDGVMLSGSRQYMDLGDFKETCLGDLELCPYGLYVSLWLKFNRLEDGFTAVLTSPIFGLHQARANLIASFRNQRHYWEATAERISVGVWYFVELSWHPDKGLSLYLDRQRVAAQPNFINRAYQALDSTHLYVGRDASRGTSYPAVTVDELNIFYADRDTLANISFIETGRPQNLHFDLNELSQDRLVHGDMIVDALGNPRIVEGKVGSAIFLDGAQDALDFGRNADTCFGNLDLCPHGMLLSLWLRPEQLKDGIYFLSTGTSGLSVLYDDRKLKVRADTASKSWETSTSNFPADKWHFMEVSFHPEKGLRLYENRTLVAESGTPKIKTRPAPARYTVDRFYLGRNNNDPRKTTYSKGAFDELDVWYADRDYLTSQGFIQRGRPERIIIPFEEITQDNSEIPHQDLDISLRGRPKLVPGKIGYALELMGNGQYADLAPLPHTCLGDLAKCQQGIPVSVSHTCMGNLARCQQGITVSAWMKFRSFENNMVFLSTGMTGLLLQFKDGYILASADGRDQISSQRLETNRWYHVELSWHPSYGLSLFVDNKQIEGRSVPFTYRGIPRDDRSHFYIGRPNYGDIPSGRYVNGNFDIDELEVWYMRREDLLAFDYINRGELGCESFPMDVALGNTVFPTKYELTLKNEAKLGPGRRGQALYLNGQGQYLDVGNQEDSCLGNLDRCPHGFTLSVWLRPNALAENMHFISAPTFFLFYEDRKLSSEFNANGRSWVVSTSNFRTGEWQRVTLAWHEVKGLRMFINDQLMDTSGGERRTINEKPSNHLYIGRNLADTRMTADVEVDELQICNDDFDQLRAVGTYKVEVFPVIISFNALRNGYIILRNRRIKATGNILLRDGLLQDSRAVYLKGQGQFLDFGDNFTCSGDLDTCKEGLTVRLSVKPENLREGMYLLDSFPVSLYYKDGRLQGEMQTRDRVWTVGTNEFKPGQWSRVEMTWHPTQGLTLYVNGVRMDYQIYADRRETSDPINWKTYVGRPLSFSDGTYANMYVDNMEFYNAHKNFITNDYYLDALFDYLRRLEEVTTRPPYTRYPYTTRPVTTTRRPIVTYWPETGKGTTRIVRVTGDGYITFDFNRLPDQYLTKTPEGDLTLMFLTDRPDGLLWLQEEPARTMYITLKDGRVVFVNDDKTGSVDKVFLGEDTRFNDYRWHTIRIYRNKRGIQLTVDDQHQETYTFPDDIQFLSPAVVRLGGSGDTSRVTRGFVNDNFHGGIASVIYRTNRQEGRRIIRNEVNLISQLNRGVQTGTVEVQVIHDNNQVTPPPTRRPTITDAPVRRTTSISVVKQGIVFQVPGLSLKSGSSITYRFKTLNQDGVMLFSGDKEGVYFAVELVDGRLYFVHNFGRGQRRTPFSEKIVTDGQAHEVEIRFYLMHVDLRVDSIRKRMDLVSGEQIPSNLGTLNVAGTLSKDLPWMVWSREGYIGCFSDLRVDSRLIDFESQVERAVGRVERGCIPVSQECTLTRPCANGQCRNTMISHLCDCSMTGFRGPRCSSAAWAALFNGSIWGQLDFSDTLKSHSDDISLRFRSPAKNGLLFQTFAKASNEFLRASMDDGRIKVETNLGGEETTLYTGKDLNDLQWHTLYIQRHGNEMEVWVDNLPHTEATLSGEGFSLNVDRLHLGGMDGSDNRYIGYLQNFLMGNVDVLQEMRGTKLNVNTFPSLPPLVYYAVTFPELNSYVTLQPLEKPEGMVLQFMFKTKETSGVLLFLSGSNKGYLVVELFEGNLYIQFSAGGAQPLRATSVQKLNDDRWHTVTIRQAAGDQRQFLLTVDGVTSSVSYAGRDDLNLNGPVYIGGMPEEVFQKDYIKIGVFSRTGVRGCLASLDLSGKVIDLAKIAKQQSVRVYDSCRTVASQACTADSCKNFGKCITVGVNTFKCDCKMSAHSGAVCLDEPLGYRYQNFSRPGLLEYSFPFQTTTGTSQEEIAFGVMTKQDNATLLRIFSEVFKDYIEFRLRNGYVEANYDTDGKGGRHTVAQTTQKVNDGKTYHIVRFIRTSDNATLHVDKDFTVNPHTSVHGKFDRMSKIYIGGGYDPAQGKILEGFDGIIGGLHINGLMVFLDAKENVNTRYLGDVVVAPRPFNLASIIDGPVTLRPPSTTTLATTRAPDVTPVPGELPTGVGGGGVGWTPKPGGGVDTQVYPGGTAGTGVLVPGNAGVGGPGAAMAGLFSAPPKMTGPGPRAGAVVGTVLALFALASALMWAFVRCKPGWCICLKPPVAEAIVSAPLLSSSNKGAVAAAGGGISGAGGAITSLEDAGLIDATAAGGGSNNAFSNYYLSASGKGAGGGSVSGGGGTAIGTPQPTRVQLGSTATATSVGAYSANYQDTSSQMRSLRGSMDRMDGASVLSPVSLQSYHYEGAGESTTADYDLVTDRLHPGYQTNTMSTRGGSVSGGSITGGGFSTNTLQSSYNYTVRNLGTVSGQQQMMGYARDNVVGIPPGALADEVRVDCCLMTGDGQSVITGSSLGPPQVWDMQSGELLRIMQGETVGSTNLHLACNDSLIVGAVNADLEANQYSVPKGVNNYVLQIWDSVSGRAMDMPQQVCSALMMMSDNDKVVFARSDTLGGGTNVVVWDLLGNQSLKDMRYDAPVGNNDYVHFLALSQNNRYAIAGFTNSMDNFAEFIVFDMTLTSYTIRDTSILRLDADPECTAVLPHDEAVTGMRNGELVIWSMRTGQPSRQLMSESGRHAHSHDVKAVAVSENNKYLVSASADGTVKLWDMESERHVHTFNGHTDEVWCCTISVDNEIVVSGSRDRTIRLWKVKDGSSICTFNAGVDIFHINMSRDKSTIVGLGDKLGARKLVMLQVVRTKVRRQVED